MLRAGFIMAALDAGVPLREVEVAARHSDSRTTTVYDRRRQDLDRHAAYVVVASVDVGTGGTHHGSDRGTLRIRRLIFIPELLLSWPERAALEQLRDGNVGVAVAW
jgi:hypothetical protein